MPDLISLIATLTLFTLAIAYTHTCARLTKSRTHA